MKIEAPLRNIDEVDPLLDAGADLFYCGVVGTKHTNNRNNNILHQFCSFHELSDAITLIHNRNKELFLTLNAYDAQIESCMEQAGYALESGVDGFIVADLRLIRALNIRYPEVPVVLSVLSGIQNSRCLDFFLEQNVKGFCFERNVSISNMKALISKYPNLEATAFISGNCQNTQLLCQLHNIPTLLPIHKHEGGYGEMICECWESESDNASDIKEIHMALGKKNWCALCALYGLKQAGVKALKIEGRALELKYKLQKVELYKKALNALNIITHEQEYHQFCRDLYMSTYGVECTNYDCFY